MIPTAKITQDITELMYLKAVFIDVSFTQVGGGTCCTWTSCEELEEDECESESDEKLRWQPTGVANAKPQTTTSTVNVQDTAEALEPSLEQFAEPTPKTMLEPAEPTSQTTVGGVESLEPAMSTEPAVDSRTHRWVQIILKPVGIWECIPEGSSSTTSLIPGSVLEEGL